MFNIHKLIKSVKDGKLSFYSFNSRMKKFAIFADDDWSDEAIEWRLQQRDEERSKVPVQPVVQEAPVATTTTPQPDQPSPLPEDMKLLSFNWVANERRDMEDLARYPVEDILMKMEEGAYFRAAPGLWELIGNNRDRHDALVSYVVDTTKVKDVAKATIFVDTFMNNSKEFKGGIDEASAREKAESELTRQEEAKILSDQAKKEKALEVDIYAYPNELSEPGLDQIFDKMWISLPIEKKREVYSLIGNFSKLPNQPYDASRYRFGPTEGNVNQRINFFLKYPEHLHGVMDSSLSDILNTRLPEGGLDVGGGTPVEIMNSLKNIKNENVQPKTKGKVINILTNEKGEELYSILEGLIKSGHPNIYKWLSAPIFNPEMTKELSTNVGDEDMKGDGEDYGDVVPALKKPDVFEQYESSEVLGKIGTDYISPILENAQGVMHGAMGDMLSSSVDAYNNAPTAEYKNEALENYSLAETINSFNLPIINHIRRLFANKSRVKGDKGGEDPLATLFTDKFGKISLPEGVVHNIVQPIEGEEEEEKALGIEPPTLDDTKGMVDRYIRRIRTGKVPPFSPSWKDMVSHQYPVDALKQMGKLKEGIRDIAKSKNITPEGHQFGDIINHFDKALGNKDGSPTLADFAGSNETDSREVRSKKIDDFIYMTLSQSGFHIEWLDKLGFQKEKEGREAFSENRSFHNLLSIIGGKYYKFFGHLANKKGAASYVKESDELIYKMTHQNYQPTFEESRMVNNAQNYTKEDVEKSKDYTDGALDVIIGLLDHHGDIRNFLKNGSAINRVDRKRRTNTELYYSLMGKEMPEYIKAMVDIHKLGLSQSGKKDAKTKMPKIDSKSWYGQLFQEYGKFDPIIRGREKAQVNLDREEEKEMAHYQKYNKKLLNEKTYKLKLNAIGRKLGADAMNEVASTVQEWAARDNIDERLPDEMYTNLGYGKLVEGKEKIAKRKKQIEEGYTSAKGKRVPGIKDLDEKSIEIKNNLKTIIEQNQAELAQSGMDIETLLPRLRLAYTAYNRALFKIASLEKMKKHNVKFASVNNVDYLDLQIAKAKTEFDHYFNSLFF